MVLKFVFLLLTHAVFREITSERRIGATRLRLMVGTFLLNCEHFDVISMFNKSTYDRKLLSICKISVINRAFGKYGWILAKFGFVFL